MLWSFVWYMTQNPNAFVDGVMNGFSLHIEPPPPRMLHSHHFYSFPLLCGLTQCPFGTAHGIFLTHCRATKAQASMHAQTRQNHRCWHTLSMDVEEHSDQHVDL